MPEYKHLYRYTLQNANEFDEVEQWRESHRENCKCANDITDAINSHYHDNRLDNCVQSMIDKYGFDRVNWVIANTNELGLFDKAAVTDETNYENQVLILKPTVLKNEYRQPDFQLFYATDGFGCDPKKIGARVFGFFLKDDEFTSFRRHDFYGVANDAALPDWALDKLNEIREKLVIEDCDTGMEASPS